MTVSRRLDLTVQYVTRQPWVPARPEVLRWVRAALDGGGTITVRFVADDEARTLNRSYRGKDYATNVLSFPYEVEPRVLGDLVIAPAVCVREAAGQGKTPDAHMAHLVVHGVLHLMGFDHQDADGTAASDAEVMEAREREVLATLGYADPYAGVR